MAHWESLPFFAVSVTLAAIALLTLVSNPRSTPHRFFAAFLLLVALNFGFDWAAKAYPQATVLAVLPRVLNAFDAAALLYFASIYPRRVGVGRHPWAAAALLGALAALAAYVWSGGVLPARADPLVPALFLYAFFASCYLGALAITARSLIAAEFATTRDAMRPLFAGLLVAVAPRIGLLEQDFYAVAAVGRWSALAIRLAVTAAVVVAFVAYVLLREARDERERTRPWLVAALAFIGAVAVFWWIAELMQSRSANIVPFASSLLYSVRWLFFAGVVGHALTRHSFLDMDRRVLRSFRGGAPILAGAAAAALILLLMRDLASHGDTTTAGGLLAAAAIGLVVALGVGGVRGARAPLSDDRDMRARKLDAYRALLEAELESGQGEGSRALAEHRRRLGLSARDHDDVTGLVHAERALRASRGPAGHVPSGYRIVRTFPSGATCWTSLAEAPDGRQVVVKVLRPEWRANDRVRGAFLAEARALSRVDHPNVVRLLEVHEHPPALVLEHAAGGSLADHVRAHGALRGAHLERFARDLLAGLAALHEAGFVHRDVKPENVLFSGDGRALIADFGSSRPMPTGATRVRMTAPGHEVGTVLYMAPEQVRGQVTDPRADLYAAAATLVFAATGRHYLGAEALDEFEVKRRIVELSPVVPSELGRLAPMVAACLAKEPEARPASMRALLAAVP